jgi:hypothetical protein
MIRTQFTLYLQNRKGALAEVLKALSVAGVNIEGISAGSTPDVGLVQLIVDSDRKTARALKARKIAFTEQQVVSVRLSNERGALARLTRRLAGAGLNLHYVYGTTCENGCACRLVVSGENLKQLEALCR